MEETACVWDAAYLLIFSPNVGPLVYYAHLLPMITSLFIGLAVLLNNPRQLVNRVLFALTLFFSTWVYFDLILWASPSPEAVLFFWMSILPFELLIYASCLYLVYLFSNDLQDVSLSRKIAVAVFFIPLILFLHTHYNVLGLSPDCDEGAIEGPLIQYMYFVELIFIVWTAIVAVRGMRRITDPVKRGQLIFIGLGTVIFMLSFTLGNLTLVFSLDPLYDQFKLFGMPVFVAFITYSIVRFNSFNTRIFAAQALVVGLGILTLSILFVRTIENVRLITGITFLFVCILGFLLLRSVRREIQQREHIERLAEDLERANAQQVTLIHFITHQIKGFVTKSRNIFAGIIEGDYGPVPDAMRPLIEEGFRSDTKGAMTIQQILDASNMKSGKMTYKSEPFNLKELIEEIVKDLKVAADQKRLALTLTAGEGPFTLTGDRMQMFNAVKNLIDNSIKYTPSGSVSITLTKEEGKIRFQIQDTGIGITPEDMQLLFTEGGHGKDFTKVNVDSTGFGLYIVKNIIEAHKGTVWAESEGAGKGSKFIVELPVS